MPEIPERLRLSTGSPNTDELLLAINAALREIRSSVFALSGDVASIAGRLDQLEASADTAPEVNLEPVLSTTPTVQPPASAGYGRPWSSGFGLGYEGAEFLYGWSSGSRPSAFGSGFSPGLRN